MSETVSDRPSFPDEDDPANQADALGEGIDPHEYFANLNDFLHAEAEQANAENSKVVDQP